VKLLFENWREYLNEGDEHADKIFTLISSAHGEMARELVITLQMNIDEKFFEKYFKYALELIGQIDTDVDNRRSDLIFKGDPDHEAWVKFRNLTAGLMGFLGSNKWFVMMRPDGTRPLSKGHWQTGMAHGSVARWKGAVDRWADAWRKSLDETPI